MTLLQTIENYEVLKRLYMDDGKMNIFMIYTYRRKMRFISLAAGWEKILSAPSKAFPHFIFLYPEDLPMKKRAN
jgi:hypothetical protein